MPDVKPCPSGKRAYASGGAALWALILGRVLGTNTYRCRQCGQWHATSHPRLVKPRRRRV